jgi:hypothetical protein
MKHEIIELTVVERYMRRLGFIRRYDYVDGIAVFEGPAGFRLQVEVYFHTNMLKAAVTLQNFQTLHTQAQSILDSIMASIKPNFQKRKKDHD